MTIIEIFKLVLLLLLVVCAVSGNLTKKLLPAVVIFMSYSIIMAIIWAMMEAPHLAVTEAAVGAGVTGKLFFLTLRKFRKSDDNREEDIE